MVVDTASAGGIMEWINNYGSVFFFFGQLIFWLVVSVAALWSTLLFRKFVNAKVERMAAKDAGAAPAKASEKPSIDQFVD